jgi:hypothetical protein
MRLRPVSKKRVVLNRQYEKAKRVWRAGHDGRCEFKRDGIRCRRRAMNNPHHTKGRGQYLSDVSTFMGVCIGHHRWIDTHRTEAVELGYFTYDFKAPAPLWERNLTQTKTLTDNDPVLQQEAATTFLS